MVEKLSKFFGVLATAIVGSAVCTILIVLVVKLVFWLIGI